MNVTGKAVDTTALQAQPHVLVSARVSRLLSAARHIAQSVPAKTGGRISVNKQELELRRIKQAQRSSPGKHAKLARALALEVYKAALSQLGILILVLGHVLSPVRSLPRHSLLLIANYTSEHVC